VKENCFSTKLIKKEKQSRLTHTIRDNNRKSKKKIEEVFLSRFYLCSVLKKREECL